MAEDWLRVREYLCENRYELSRRAAELYPASRRVAGTDLLADPAWIPPSPVPLDAVALSRTDPPAASMDGWEQAVGGVLPGRADGTAASSYAEAMAEFARPTVFENRTTYRLLDADLRGPAGALTFCGGRYFDSTNVGEACAHEFAAACLGLRADLPLRDIVGEPWRLRRRFANVAISTLTLRVDRAAGQASFPLHWRDPAKVGHAGGLYQVVPVGMFQASSDAPQNQARDFDLWRCMLREFAEELLGMPEEYGPAGSPVDYEGWPFARQMSRARADGTLTARVVGMGVDPLTFATDILAVVAIDAAVFDELLGAMVHANAEGQVLLGEGQGLSFSASTIDRLLSAEPMQAAGAALLRLAWEYRDNLVASGTP
ncbi:MAG TPA: hypothetical protein VFV73_13205 [Streptosporangiaceae bacterium]|nr:hypothetical protein [Streptosporangiaceae bacterium]